MDPELNYYPIPTNEINGSVTKATGANLTILTAGEKSDASTLHYHAGSMSSGKATQPINDTTTLVIAHGLKVIPSLVQITCLTRIDGASGGHTEIAHCEGAGNSTAQSSIYLSWELNNVSNMVSGNSTNIIDITSTGGSGKFQATMTLDATNITLTFGFNTNTGATRQILWRAYK